MPEFIFNPTNTIEKYSFIHNFVPHEKLQKEAHLISNKALILYIFSFLLVFILIKTVSIVSPATLGFATEIYSQELYEMTNSLRVKYGLNELKYNDKLAIAANNKARDMFEKNYWAHVSPDGVKPWDFITEQGYDYQYAGENLAKNFNTSSQVIEAWFNSESHRENLLNPNYDEIGFAVVDGVLDGYETTLVVQMFGRTKESVLLAKKEQKNSNSPQVVVLNDTNPNLVKTSISSEHIGEVKSFRVNVDSFSKYLITLFVAFLILMLLVDLWYSRKKGIFTLKGYAFAHIMFLSFILAGVWFVLSQGRVL